MITNRQTSTDITELQTRFGNSETLLAAFNPSQQIRFCRDVDRCHFGNAPTLGMVRAAYGDNVSEVWLQIQLNDLSEFAGCREKIKPHQINELAGMIAEDYGHYRLTEFMLFFQRFKSCRYGRFYGAVDPMVILQALADFDRERMVAVNNKRKEDEQASRQTEDDAYKELRQRYAQRVPDAFTPAAAIDFLQYRLMGYDCMPDDRLAQEIDEIKNGRKTLPKDVANILAIVRKNFEINN